MSIHKRSWAERLDEFYWNTVCLFFTVMFILGCFGGIYFIVEKIIGWLS